MLYGLLAITAIIVYYAIKLVIRARNVVRKVEAI